MDATVDVGIVVLIIFRNCLQHGAWFLSRGGIVEIEDYLRRTGRFDQLEECPELHFLREWETEVESARPMSKLEQLREELRLAVERDQFERAADLRDRLRDLEREQVGRQD